MVNKINNCFLVNAPAGSGKTTEIKTMVRQFISQNPKDNILCITYTKRAANELSKDIKTHNVFIGTIHSFLNTFMKQYFSHQDIINLYFEMFGETIKARIANINNDKRIANSNEKYKEKYGDIKYDIVKANIKTLFYNESSYSSYYYGGLSHDDLIRFSKFVIDKFPKIKKRISSKYQYIFIDEYQDTTADILNIFYDSVVGTNTKLYLFGDKMQQIYKNYDGSFEDKFAFFNTSKILKVNHRSVKEIVSILNKIYNDPNFEQDISEEMKQVHPKFAPRVIVCDNVESKIEEIRDQDPETLVLFLFNKERFHSIGCQNLYNAFSHMEKYSYGKTYNCVDVLTTDYVDNPDPLIKMLYIIVELYSNYQNNQYGLIIKKFKNYKEIFNKDGWYITSHSDKKKLHDNLNEIFSILTGKEKTIGDLLDVMKNNLIIQPSFLENIVNDSDYKLTFSVPINEIFLMINYLRKPQISTQHGVKGESHDSVVFVAENSGNNPIVHMYLFFEMWGKLNISLSSFQQFYYSYIKELSDLQNAIGCKINELNKESYIANEKKIKEKAVSIYKQFNKNPFFIFLCAKKYEKFLGNPTVSGARDCLNENTVYGVLSAYKLFYVGCSRARKNLTILIRRDKISGDFASQKRKFEELGFTVL